MESKPFSIKELLARMRSALGRSSTIKEERSVVSLVEGKETEYEIE
jgi:DNA-binding response OmpR family regulator